MIVFQGPGPKVFLRAALVFSVFLAIAALFQFQQQIVAEELFFTSLNFRAALYLGYLGVALLLGLSVWSFSSKWQQLLNYLGKLANSFPRSRGLSIALIIASLAIYLQLVLGFYGRFLLNPFPRLMLFWLFSLLVSTFLANGRKMAWLSALPASILLMALVFNAATFLEQVNSYPLSLGWSEISRYYQASFFFGEKVYGQSLAWPVTHPSRYVIQSVPFLLGELPLWVHRAWQALLWLSMASLTAWALKRRLRIKDNWLSWLFIAWTYLYLMQGAVFYHLLPAVILILLSFNSRRFWRSLLFVGVASIWAGISRINWVPMPAALAVILYLLERPVNSKKKSLDWDYWRHPVTYFFVGSLTALLAYSVYISMSGIADRGQFGSSFTSALLWDRLWPTTDLPTGILPGILIVSLPLFLVVWQRYRSGSLSFAWQRTTALLTILLVFFIGGLIVSVKIGGGTNLHNMDAYMVLLLVLVSHIAFGEYAPESKEAKSQKMPIAWPLLASLLLIPSLTALLTSGPLTLPASEKADAAVDQIREMVTDSLEDGKEVLFISQRHLITFNEVDAPLVHDYEKLFLMEMAISQNDAYLSGFQEDMQNQRFGLIITDPLHRNIREVSEDSLAAENNAWVRFVSRPILCAYQPALTLSDLTVQVLEPRDGSSCD
jgi:hypothetical protein